MSQVTLETLTDEMIRELRGDAVARRDNYLADLCSVALNLRPGKRGSDVVPRILDAINARLASDGEARKP